MKEKVKLTIIIPCYNEEGNLKKCVERIPFKNESSQIIIVNDGSKDNTQKIAEEIAKDDKRIKVINFLQNKGKTQALKEALKEAKGEIIMIQDADLTVSEDYLKIFYKKILSKPNSFLMGTRFKFKIEKKAMSKINLISNKITAKIFSLLLQQKITDTLCGTKVFPKRLENFIKFSKCRWPDFDLLIAAKKMNLNIEEIPVKYKTRKYGKPSMKIYPDGFKLFKRLIKAIWQLK